MESVGFKEWAAVCEALGRGRQSIIIRKGGIAEGRDGFSFRHNEFFLFPTWFHGADDKVRDFEVRGEATPNGSVAISFFARVDAVRTITSWPAAEALEGRHILQTEVVRERFGYGPTPGLHVAFVRVYRLEPVWILADEPRFGGCRSWVDLPERPKLQFEPVLDDAEHARRRREFLAITAAESHEPVRPA